MARKIIFMTAGAALFSGMTVWGAPTTIHCPAVKDMKAGVMPTVSYAADDGWTGDAKLGKVMWFFNGTEPVVKGEGDRAVLSCQYGNRGNALTLTMTHPTFKASQCKQSPCEKSTGKGATQKMLDACVYTCE